jgi:hypothetical protein
MNGTYGRMFGAALHFKENGERPHLNNDVSQALKQMLYPQASCNRSLEHFHFH